MNFEITSPFLEKDYGKVWEWLQQFGHQTLDDNSPKSLEDLMAKARQDKAAGGKSYAIYSDGSLVGAIWCEPMPSMKDMCIGHLVFERDFKDKVSATNEAIERIRRSYKAICWMYFNDNRAFRIFLRKIGAKPAGTFKDAIQRKGKGVDMGVMVS